MRYKQGLHQRKKTLKRKGGEKEKEKEGQETIRF